MKRIGLCRPLNVYNSSTRSGNKLAKMPGLGYGISAISKAVRLEIGKKTGIPVPVVMNVSGRNTRPVFGRYAIGDEKDLQEAANRQPAYFEISGINSPTTKKNTHATV